MHQVTPVPQGMTEFDRLTGVLFDPRPAFADVAARPRWWVPLALLSLLVLVFTISFSQRVGWERVMREQMESNPQIQQLSPERREEVLQQQLGFVSVVAPVGSALSFPGMALVLAGVFLFVFNVLVGTQLTFRQAFAVTCYALLPYALATLLAFVLLFVKSPADFDLQNPVASNIAAFLDPNTTPAWLLSVGKSVDLFTVWVLVLLATGFSAAARKLDWSKALSWVVTAWAVWLVVKGVWTWVWP